MSKAISRKRCKIRPRLQLMTNKKIIPVESNGTTLDPLIWILGLNMRKLFIFRQLMELERSNVTRRYLWTRTQTPRKNFSLGVAGHDSAPTQSFKLLELSETRRLQVNIIEANTDADMTLPGIWYIRGPAKIHNPHVSVLYNILRSQVQVQCDIYAVPVQWLFVYKRK